MNTQYVDFKKYLENKFPDCNKKFDGLIEGYQTPDGDIAYNMDEVIGALIRTLDDCTEPDWKNLEACLANDFLDNIRWDNEWSFNEISIEDDGIFHSIYENEELSNSIIGAYSYLKELFGMWVHENLKNIDFRRIEKMKSHSSFDSSLFLNFNYTFTLESLYGIEDDKVCHIHGDVNSDGMDILFGHGDDNPWDEDYSYMGILDAFDKLKRNLRKNTNGVIEKNADFFYQLAEVTTIYSYGFSFSDVDMVYIDEICRNIDVTKVSWYFNQFDWVNNSDNVNKIKKLGFNVKKSLDW